MGPLPNGRTPWLINGGDPNYLLTGMILQVGEMMTSPIGLVKTMVMTTWCHSGDINFRIAAIAIAPKISALKIKKNVKTQL